MNALPDQLAKGRAARDVGAFTDVDEVGTGEDAEGLKAAICRDAHFRGGSPQRHGGHRELNDSLWLTAASIPAARFL